MKFILFIAFSLSFPVWCQELDVSFLETQRPASEPYNIPLSINERGEIHLGRGGDTNLLSINTTFQSTYRRSTIVYTSPIPLNSFQLYPAYQGLGWLEIKRTQWELGVGLAALMKDTLTMGLIPYKGAIQTSIRYKERAQGKLTPFRMPEKLLELENWREGDSGKFQTYGGIQAYLGASSGLINVATASIGIQNQFIVEVKKISKNTVILKLTEEKSHRHQFLVGPYFTYATMGRLDGKRLNFEFILDSSNPHHHALFEEALAGNVAILQSSLNMTDQKISWEGTDRSFYYGIPMVAGGTRVAGSYLLIEDENEAELNVSGRENGGFLRRHRSIYQYLYQIDKGLVLLWTAEANKVTRKDFIKNFFSKGRIIGVKGFDQPLPLNITFGSVISQIGMTFSKAELESLKKANLDEIRNSLKERCQKEGLSCQNEIRLNKIMGKFRSALKSPWKELRERMGRLMVKEPALIYSLVQTQKLKKKVYFKFLSEKYQSLEGLEEVEL